MVQFFIYMFKGSVYIVDDDPDVLYTANLILKNKYQTVKVFKRPDQAFSEYKKHPSDVVLLDMNFKMGATTGNEGLFWLKEFIKIDKDAHVVLNTAYGDINVAVQGMKEGAIDFLVKPWEHEKLLATINNVYQLRKSRQKVAKLESENMALNDQLSSQLGSIIYTSEEMSKVMDIVRRVAPTDANVLIIGENGVGKELVARAIYENSKRKDGPFVRVDVGSITSTLFESELFGHVKGAFTDARADRAGRFEIADGGTLFLDEISNISLEIQGKLLSILQNRKVVRVGSNKEVPVDVRLVSATNKDINQLIDENQFREDLYFRINTVEIEIPPLRDRREDIKSISRHFLEKHSKKYDKENISIPPKTMDFLMEYSWPGNVRELDHAIERAVIMSNSAEIVPDDFALKRNTQIKTEGPINVEEVEKETIEKALKKFKGNMSRAASELGMARSTLYRKIEKYEIQL